MTDHLKLAKKALLASIDFWKGHQRNGEWLLEEARVHASIAAIENDRETNTLLREMIQQNKESRLFRAQRDELLRMTIKLVEHPEGYEGPCLCQECQIDGR
jgi:hypothetical protein